MSYEVSKQRLIYVFGIAADTHNGLLKIGDTTIKTAEKICRRIVRHSIKPHLNALKNIQIRWASRQSFCTQNLPSTIKMIRSEIIAFIVC